MNALLQASLCSDPTEGLDRGASAASLSLWDTKAGEEGDEDLDDVLTDDDVEDTELDDHKAEQLQRAMLSFYSNVSSSVPGEEEEP